MLVPFCATTVLPWDLDLPSRFGCPDSSEPELVTSTTSSTCPGSFSRQPLLSLLALAPLGCEREEYGELIEFAAACKMFNDLTTSAGARGDTMSGAGNGPVLDGDAAVFDGDAAVLLGEGAVLDGEAAPSDIFGDASLIDCRLATRFADPSEEEFRTR